MPPPGPFIKLQYERGVECSVKIIRKADALARLNPAFSSLELELYLENGSIGDPQIDLGLAQDRTYKVSKQKGYRAAKQASFAAKTFCT